MAGYARCPGGGYKRMSQGAYQDCACPSGDIPDDNTEPCLCCTFYRIALWNSASPLFDYDGDGDLDPASGAIWTAGYTDLPCSIMRDDAVTRLIFKDGGGKWNIDPFGDGSLIIQSVSADLPCPPIGPSAPPADGTDQPGVWTIGTNTTGVTTWEVFAFECCDGAVNCLSASDDLFIDGVIGHLKLDSGTFPDNSGLGTWDGHVHRYPAGAPIGGGADPDCLWAAAWDGPAMDGTYSARQVRVGMKGGGFAALTPLFGPTNVAPYKGWRLAFVETGLSGGLVSWLKLCGSLPYATKRYIPDSPDPSVLKIPPLISVTDGS